MTISWAQALSWRLERQFLHTPTSGSVVDVVNRLGAVPAISGDPELAMGLRRNVTRIGGVAEELAAGRLIKTYAFRGATQLMTPESARVFLTLRSAGRQWELPSWQSYYRLTPQEWPRLRAIVRDALGAGPLTRQELAAAVVAHSSFDHLGAAFVSSSDTFLKPFAWQGDLSFGPVQNDQSTFVALGDSDDWTNLDQDEAGRMAVVAYYSAYGPAPHSRVQYWLGEGLSAGKRRIARWLNDVREDLTEIIIDGEPALCLAAHVEDVSKGAASQQVHLIPGYDQWVLGPGTSDTHIVTAARRSAATRGAGLVLNGGRVTGTWKIGKDSLAISWFAEEGKPPENELEGQTERICRLLGRNLRMTLQESRIA